jgi:hypothetical protein
MWYAILHQPLCYWYSFSSRHALSSHLHQCLCFVKAHCGPILLAFWMKASLFYDFHGSPWIFIQLTTFSSCKHWWLNCWPLGVQCFPLHHGGTPLAVHKVHLQNEVGRWLSKFQQGVGRWSVICQRWLFSFLFKIVPTAWPREVVPLGW